MTHVRIVCYERTCIVNMCNVSRATTEQNTYAKLKTKYYIE